MTSRKAVDWVAIENSWAKSDESVRELAARKGVSHVAILKRAKAEGWPARRPDARKAPPKVGNQKFGNSAPVTRRGNLNGNHAGGNQASDKQAKSPGKILAVIREWPKNRQEVARITIEEFNGHVLVRCWSWYRDVMTGELKPSKKGWALSIDQVVAQLVPGIDEALLKAKELGLLATGEVDR